MSPSKQPDRLRLHQATLPGKMKVVVGDARRKFFKEIGAKPAIRKNKRMRRVKLTPVFQGDGSPRG
jgi:hypothetical protein